MRDKLTKEGCVRFAVRYFGTGMTAFFIALTWDMHEGPFWWIFVAAVCYLGAIPWGWAMWWYLRQRQ